MCMVGCFIRNILLLIKLNIYPLTDFDFTAARGMGSLQKELAKANVPLFLMSADKDIGVILKESTNIDFPTIDCPDDLEYLLDQSESGFNSSFIYANQLTHCTKCFCFIFPSLLFTACSSV